MGKKGRICLIVFSVLVMILSIAVRPAETSENDSPGKGAEMISLKGGILGKVPFPHRLHQKALDDCNACHDMFPRQRRAIQAQQEKGELKKQQVMDEVCIKCHVARQSGAEPAGPSQCGSCHQR